MQVVRVGILRSGQLPRPMAAAVEGQVQGLLMHLLAAAAVARERRGQQRQQPALMEEEVGAVQVRHPV